MFSSQYSSEVILGIWLIDADSSPRQPSTSVSSNPISLSSKSSMLEYQSSSDNHSIMVSYTSGVSKRIMTRRSGASEVPDSGVRLKHSTMSSTLGVMPVILYPSSMASIAVSYSRPVPYHIQRSITVHVQALLHPIETVPPMKEWKCTDDSFMDLVRLLNFANQNGDHLHAVNTTKISGLGERSYSAHESSSIFWPTLSLLNSTLENGMF